MTETGDAVGVMAVNVKQQPQRPPARRSPPEGDAECAQPAREERLAAAARRRLQDRCLRYEFFSAIFPSFSVKMSQPLTSTLAPAFVVPVKVHSETARFPATK